MCIRFASKWYQELKNCTRQKDLAKGSQIHAYLLRIGLLEHDNNGGFALLDFYAKCGVLSEARLVFDLLNVPSMPSWNTLITGYTQNGYGQEALACFMQAQQEGMLPDVVTFMSILKACCSMRSLNTGKEIHARIVHGGLLKKDVLIGTALVDMYAKCGALARAQGVFNEIGTADVVCWNVMIGVYIQYARFEEALCCFGEMQANHITPNVVTFIYALKACGSISASDQGKQIHDLVSRDGFLDKHASLGNALVDMYVRCGCLSEAEDVFDGLFARDVISWTTLFGHASSKKEGLQFFEQIKQEGVLPNDVTFLSMMKACGSMGTTSLGKRIHVQILGQSLVREKHTIGSALVDMYAKCSELPMALEAFSELGVRNVVSWTALIAGYGHVGEEDTVIRLFNKMIGEGIQPDSVTFTVVLHACGHSGVLEKGQLYFELMSAIYGIVPTSEHHACMVGLFSRAGHFDEAVAAIRKMPMPDHLPAWSSLLGACQKCGNVEIGELAFKLMATSDDKVAGAYVSMSNIYAQRG
jgi:pentatricopeptide repeat protein